MKHLRRYIRHLILELKNRPLQNIDELLKHADSALESSTFFEDMEDFVLKELLSMMGLWRRGGIRLNAPVSWQLTGDLNKNAEQMLRATIERHSTSRHHDRYNIRGFQGQKIPNNTFITKDSTKKSLLDLIYGKPGYADVLEAIRGYLKFNEELIQHHLSPENTDPELVPVYEMAATQNIEDFKQAYDLWDMLR